MSYTKDDIEKAGVNHLESIFLGKPDFKTFFKSGDKDDIIDGHLLYKTKYKFNVQIKSSEKNNNSKIDKKYILFASSQDLIYFYCPFIFEQNKKIFYKIFAQKEIIEDEKYVKMGKTISLNKCGFKKFDYNTFVEELNYHAELKMYKKVVDGNDLFQNYILSHHILKLDKDKLKFIEDIFMLMNDVTIKGEFNRFKFNDFKFKSINTLIEENGFTYKVESECLDCELKLFANEKSFEFKIDDEVIKCKKSVDAMNNVRISIGKSYIDLTGFDEKTQKFDTINYCIQKFSAIDFDEQMNMLKILKNKFFVNTTEISENSEFSDILKYEKVLELAKLFKSWLIKNELLDLVASLDKKDIEILFKEYQYYSFIDTKTDILPLLRAGDNKFIYCFKSKNELSNIKNAHFGLGNGLQHDIFLNECFILFFSSSDEVICALLNSINIDLEKDVIKLLKGYSLIENDKLSNIEAIRKFGGYQTLLLELIKIYIFSKNEEIYSLLIKELSFFIDNEVFFINYIQLKMHGNKDIKLYEYERLEGILKNTEDSQIKLCCLILLKHYKQKEVYNALSDVEKSEFEKFPIFRLRSFNLYTD